MSMLPAYFPLRWESTGDQWWYASPIDWAAANGHYDLVRELLRIDGNHLINLTSLRRIRRLETVWDDEEQFHDVTRCRTKVSKKLFQECECKKGENSLLQAGYGGWLLYTAASSGDFPFVEELLQRNSFLVFGEGEYGVTDIFYAAARSKNSDVFWLIFESAVSPKGEDVPPIFKMEIMNRATHAAARGGNSTVLKKLLRNCTNVLAYRDKHGSTILHAAAARGQDEVIYDLVSSFDIIGSKDIKGNSALHIAAYRGQPSAVRTLITANPSLICSVNDVGDNFVHMAISGFSAPTFRRVDRQIGLMKQLINLEIPNMRDVINTPNKEGRTPLHMAVIANLQVEFVQLLMSAPSINVNCRDNNGMTPLDLLKQKPRSVSSDILIRQLISAGGVFSYQDLFSARRAMVSRLKLEGGGRSPGTFFRIPDAEIFLYAGIKILPDSTYEFSSPATKQDDRSDLNRWPLPQIRRKEKANNAAQRLKRILHWPRSNYRGGPQVTPIPLRQRFSKPPSPSASNKRTISARSNQTSPTSKKSCTTVFIHGTAHLTKQGRSRSDSFSGLSISSSGSTEITTRNESKNPSCHLEVRTASSPAIVENVKVKHKRSKSQYLCFGATAHTPISKHKRNQSANTPIISVC